MSAYQRVGRSVLTVLGARLVMKPHGRHKLAVIPVFERRNGNNAAVPGHAFEASSK
ncbi:hypothetical protein [Candidatus Phyllobacterium onerii]|uniref:hypothetical protein n=1 Tax=Candidatus Phyllobacterium onerii TaxID=3020828 RepID=UPI0023315273|nr:hypothetical protein [Phyllobacterium sp. IY22]